MTSFLALVLAVEYAVAAFVRLRCIRICREMKGWYHASIACCVVSSASFVWLLAYGDSANRLLIVRISQLVLVPSALIWPAVIATGARRAEIRRAALAMTKQVS